MKHDTSLDKEGWARLRFSARSPAARGWRTHESEREVGNYSAISRGRTGQHSFQFINIPVAAALLLGFLTPLTAQQLGPSPTSGVETVPKVTHVLGLAAVKRGAKGRLGIAGNALRFYVGAATEDVSIPAIQDVFTDQDSKQLVRGKMGTLVRLAMPYESGRALSLLAEKTDVLTVEYQDLNGGLHGVIFSLPKGQAVVVKRLLVEQGAHVSLPPEAPAKP